MMLWTVARSPNGTWSYGGQPTDPNYAGCEVYSIEAPNAKVAVTRARDKRYREKKKAPRNIREISQ